MRNHISDTNMDVYDLNFGVAAALEAKRLAEKYNRDFFDASDLMDIMGVGEANIRKLMASEDFPVTKIGNRNIISALAFSMWIIKNHLK